MGRQRTADAAVPGAAVDAGPPLGVGVTSAGACDAALCHVNGYSLRRRDRVAGDVGATDRTNGLGNAGSRPAATYPYAETRCSVSDAGTGCVKGTRTADSGRNGLTPKADTLKGRHPPLRSGDGPYG